MEPISLQSELLDFPPVCASLAASETDSVQTSLLYWTNLNAISIVRMAAILKTTWMKTRGHISLLCRLTPPHQHKWLREASV